MYRKSICKDFVNISSVSSDQKYFVVNEICFFINYRSINYIIKINYKIWLIVQRKNTKIINFNGFNNIKHEYLL